LQGFSGAEMNEVMQIIWLVYGIGVLSGAAATGFVWYVARRDQSSRKNVE
jgi:hypothetical protein